MEATISDSGRNHLFCVGLSHRTTDIGLREKIYVRPAHLQASLEELRDGLGIQEAVILSTCNRFEIYTTGEPDGLKHWISSRAGERAAEVSKMLALFRQLEAIRHLFSVAGGLEAQVLGETQILGQVREAYEAAQKIRMTGPALNTLFQRAITVGKRLRRETRLSETPVSVSSVAVRLCEKIFGNLAGHRALIVGAGEISSLAAEQLFERGAKLTIFSTRGREAAESLAQLLASPCRPMEDLPLLLAQADIIVSASGAPHILVKKSEIQEAQHQRNFRPLLLVDLAIPRDIDPEVEKLENVFLYNLDDLQGIAEEHRREREKEIPKCEEIIHEEAGLFWEATTGAEHESTLRRFHEQIAHVVDQELTRAGISGMPLESLRKSIPNRILSEAFKRSRGHLAADERQALLKALKEFFGL